MPPRPACLTMRRKEVTHDHLRRVGRPAHHQRGGHADDAGRVADAARGDRRHGPGGAAVRAHGGAAPRGGKAPRGVVPRGGGARLRLRGGGDHPDGRGVHDGQRPRQDSAVARHGGDEEPLYRAERPPQRVRPGAARGGRAVCGDAGGRRRGPGGGHRRAHGGPLLHPRLVLHRRGPAAAAGRRDRPPPRAAPHRRCGGGGAARGEPVALFPRGRRRLHLERGQGHPRAAVHGADPGQARSWWRPAASTIAPTGAWGGG